MILSIIGNISDVDKRQITVIMNAGEHKDYRIFFCPCPGFSSCVFGIKDIITGNLSKTKFKLSQLTAWVYQTDQFIPLY